jgi:GTP-binding protein
MAEVVAASRSARPPAQPERLVIRPAAEQGPDFDVRRVGDLWQVFGEKPERWVRQTDFGNDEAVGFLADRLARLGVEERLLELGAEVGDGVLIGPEDNAVVFDFDPQVQAGAETLMTRRGQDPRLEGR